MIPDEELILNLPCDERANSTTAYDYSPGRHDAAVSSASFTPGRQGNCLHFDGAGQATIDSNVIDLNGDFTLLAWIKPHPLGDSSTRTAKIGFFVINHISPTEDLTEWLELPLQVWTHIALVKETQTLSVYIDTQFKAQIQIGGLLRGFAIIQDYYTTDLAIADIDEVKIYSIALTQEQITESLNDINQLEYYINGQSLRDMGVIVKSSTGVLDRPKLKSTNTTDCPDDHGEVVDLFAKRYSPRDITLNCWMRATGKMDFITRVNNLLQEFDTAGTARLTIALHPTKPLVYEVYLPEGVSFDKTWRDNKMIGSFSLKLREPQPVKRVLRFQRTSDATAQISVTIKSPSALSIFWGDGIADHDLVTDDGSAATYSHTYAADGIYYPIVAGVIEAIEEFTTNAIVVWDKI